MTRHINPAGLEIVKHNEGLRLDAYQDITGVWTIGYGHTPAHAGQRITEDQAVLLLQNDLFHAEQAVEGATHDVPTSDNQFSAMVTLAFNIGAGGFRGSTALRKHRRHDFKGAAEAFLLWDKAHVDDRLVIVPALLRRRREERALYLTPVAHPGRTPSHRANDPDHSADDLNRAELDRLK